MDTIQANPGDRGGGQKETTGAELIGAVIACLEPQGMSRAVFATAFAMTLVPAIALIIGTPAFANGVVAVFGLHALLAMPFVGSALLFRRASANRL